MSISTDLFVVNIFCLVKDFNSKQFRPVVVSQSKSDFLRPEKFIVIRTLLIPRGMSFVPFSPPLPLHLILDSFDSGGKG